MKPEEFEVYIIPPNFMEGGTLFGGLLKTRNTIEAVILGLAVGVPVLRLPFSLTVRVVILCLTALPLVLLALIGVSGMSLSAFIRLFFCFLHNRRILSRDGTQGGKNKKTLLPSWAQQRKSDCEAEDPPLPKSRSRFSVDLKQRSVTQFKTFLQEEEAVQPLNALADYIPIEKIEHGVIYTRDHRYVKVVEVVPVNFLLRSAREQRSIIYSFISYVINGNNYVKLRDMGKAVGFEVYWDSVNGCVQVESNKPYTGEAPAKAEPDKSESHPEPAVPANDADVDAMKQDIVDRTNALRKENGIAALTADDKLMQAAQVRAEEMAASGVYSHIRPDGRKYMTVTDSQYIGENIHCLEDWALKEKSLPETVMWAWSASAGHLKNMTNSRYGSIGVGLAKSTDENGEDCWYCVQLFMDTGCSISWVDRPAAKQ